MAGLAWPALAIAAPRGGAACKRLTQSVGPRDENDDGARMRVGCISSSLDGKGASHALPRIPSGCISSNQDDIIWTHVIRDLNVLK